MSITSYISLLTSIFILSCASTKNTGTQENKQPVKNPTAKTVKKDSSSFTIAIPEKTLGIDSTSATKLITEKINHSLFDKLLQKHVSIKGSVNYKGFIADKQQLNNYLLLLSETAPSNSWTKEDKLAYWMNAYNAFTIKLIIDHYPIKSIKNIKSPWDYRFIKINKKWYTLNDIEHRILRKMNEPKIHFGINCASYSCPPLLNKAFTSANVNNDLEFLAHQFINDNSRNTISENNIEVSKIFQWFSKDFKKDGTLIDFLNNYSNIQIMSTAKKSYKKYDWNLNE